MECKNPSSSDSVSLCPALRPPLLEIVNTLAVVVCCCLLVGMDMRPGLGHTKPEKEPDKHVKKSAQNNLQNCFCPQNSHEIDNQFLSDPSPIIGNACQ